MKSSGLNKKWILTGILVVVAAISFLFRSRDEKPLAGVMHVIFRPFASFTSGIGFWVHQRADFFGSISQMKQENESLRSENLQLQSQLAQLKDVKSENDVFRQELSLAPRGTLTLEAALVIGKDISGRNDIVYLNKGESAGITTGMAVVVHQGILVGKVVQTTAQTATVELLLSREIRIKAELTESHEKGLVQGAYGTAVTMDDIPQTVEVKPGDTVITAEGGTLPQGLLIGYVKDVTQTPDQLFQQASLILPVRLQQIRMVWVVKQ